MQTLTKLRKLTREDVDIIIETHPEWIPIRGNAILSGDPNFDRQVEDELIQRLSEGDIWAWCSVTVKARWNGFEGEDHLGACSYADEEDFKRGIYYDEMVGIAIDELNKEIERQYAKLSELTIIKPSLAQQIANEAIADKSLVSWEQVERFIKEAADHLSKYRGDAIDALALYNEAVDIASDRWVELYD